MKLSNLILIALLIGVIVLLRADKRDSSGAAESFDRTHAEQCRKTDFGTDGYS